MWSDYFWVVYHRIKITCLFHTWTWSQDFISFVLRFLLTLCSSVSRVQQWAAVFSVELRDLTVKYSGSLLLQKVNMVKLSQDQDYGQDFWFRFIMVVQVLHSVGLENYSLISFSLLCVHHLGCIKMVLWRLTRFKSHIYLACRPSQCDCWTWAPQHEWNKRVQMMDGYIPQSFKFTVLKPFRKILSWFRCFDQLNTYNKSPTTLLLGEGGYIFFRHIILFCSTIK